MPDEVSELLDEAAHLACDCRAFLGAVNSIPARELCTRCERFAEKYMQTMQKNSEVQDDF